MKFSLSATILLLTSSASVALAQNTTALPFAACLLPCDTAALAKVGCSATDNLCHCEHAAETFSFLVPCVLNNSTCGTATLSDLSSFGAFAASTCVPYNITVPSIESYFPNNSTVAPPGSNSTVIPGSNSTGGGVSNTTGGVGPKPTVYEGAAAGKGDARAWAVVALAAGGFALAL
ncbi:hypothetical protein AAFC00_006156 [Neodothiora populina]|uniref:CFEM domain-containing protein n=1 Tax=Neodothiora populina TaxID=2781224 RepID=A0ABR3P5K7_9PEZI